MNNESVNNGNNQEVVNVNAQNISQTGSNTNVIDNNSIQNVQGVMQQQNNLETNQNQTQNVVDNTINNNVNAIDNLEVLDSNGLQNSNQNSELSTQPPSFIKPVEPTNNSTEDLLNAVPKPDMMISSPADTSISTEDLLEDFIQNNYEKITKKKLNFAALFLGITYVYYRKMYLLGIILSILIMISMYMGIIINPTILLAVGLANIILAVLFCLLFNKIYISSAKRKIDRIKAKHKTISVSELRKLCNKKGGTSLVLAIVLPIVISGVSMSIFNIIFPIDSEEFMNNFTSMLNNSKVSNNINEDNSTDKNVEKDKNINEQPNLSNIEYFDNISLSDKLSMQYLSIFKPTSENLDSKYDYIKLTNASDENSYCKFNLGIVKDYKTSKDFIKDLSNYYKVKEVENYNTTSGLTWSTFIKDDNGDTIYYAGIDNNNEVYLFKYTIGAGANESLCKAYYTGIIESIQFN